MVFFNIIEHYKAFKNGVIHSTFNPNGPGCVRIHLIPPKFHMFKRAEYIVILNGYYILPLGYSWAILLKNFLIELNTYDGKQLSDSDIDLIYKNAIQKTSKAFIGISKDYLSEDLDNMLNVFLEISKSGNTNAEIGELSIRKYSKNMTAPHRLDLLISSMSDENGNWKCNQKCQFCYASGQDLAKTKELSTQEWKDIIDRCKKAHIPMLTFTGGEPTLRNDLTELISYSKWFVTRLNTNGVLLTEELVKNLINAELDSIQITFYSYDKEIHNKLVGADLNKCSGNYDKTLQGIKNAVQGGLDVSINTPLCTMNRDYLSTLKLLKELNVKYVTCSGLICTGNAEKAHENSDLNSQELYDILKEATIFCYDNGIEISFTSPGLIDSQLLRDLKLTVPYCGAALSNMAIAPNGDVIPCQSWLSSDFNLGNMLKDDWKKIWNNELCTKIRNMTESESLCCPFRKKSIR